FRKAYTVVTMGPIFGFDRTSAYAESVNKNPAGAGPALFSLPDVIALPGGVAIKRGNEIVAGLGVGGAPGGDRDEACAQEGVDKIAPRVNANR
ncbi:MAG: heme-binding protein, partial [Rhodomicrobium sp.]